MSAPPETNAPTKRRSFAKSRWYYQEDGRDIGPFRPSELRQLLLDGKVRADSPVRESAGTAWRKLHEIDGFAVILKEIKAELSRRAHERELDKAVDRARQKRNLPLVIGGVVCLILAVVGGWFAWDRLREQEAAAASGYTTAMYRNLELAEIPARAYLDTSGPIRWADEEITLPPIPEAEVAAARKTRTGGKRAGGPRYVRSGDDLAPEDSGGVRELDFSSDSGGGVGRELDMGDVASVRNRTVPKLRNCAVAEATRNSAFPGTTVRFSILGSGKLGKVGIGKNGKRSGAFVSCVNGALSGVSVGAFDGPGRTITVPLKIQR